MSTGDPSGPSPAKKKQYYRKKRKFHGNRYTGKLKSPAPPQDVPPPSPVPQTASYQKLAAASTSKAEDDELSGYRLSKCAHGGTQNPNESIHNIIWSRCPKKTFVGRNRLQVAVHDAVIAYNDGETERLKIFNRLRLAVGKYMEEGFRALDAARVQASIVLSTAESKAKRKQKRLSAADEKAKETSYKPGGW